MTTAKSKSRKDRIMEAALRVFAEKCYQDATITEISKEAEVSEATIYEYFGTKEDLLFAIPERISNEGYEELTRVLPFIKGAEGRIRAVVYGYGRLYQSNPNYSALVLLQLMINKRFRQTNAFSAIRRSARLLLECIKEGIKDGTFKQDTDPYLVRSMLLGTLEHLFIHWHMQGRPQGPREIMAYLDPYLDIIFAGIRAPKEEPLVFVRIPLTEMSRLEAYLKGDVTSGENAGETGKRERKVKSFRRKEQG